MKHLFIGYVKLKFYFKACWNNPNSMAFLPDSIFICVIAVLLLFSLLKGCLSVISSPITHLINCSVSSGSVPLSLNTAAVTPVLKKSGLDSSAMNTFRPVSTSSFHFYTARKSCCL